MNILFILVAAFCFISSRAGAQRLWERGSSFTEAHTPQTVGNLLLAHWDGAHILMYRTEANTSLMRRDDAASQYAWLVKTALIDTRTGEINAKASLQATTRDSTLTLVGDTLIQCDAGLVRFYSKDLVEIAPPFRYQPAQTLLAFSRVMMLGSRDRIAVSSDGESFAVITSRSGFTRLYILARYERRLVKVVDLPIGPSPQIALRPDSVLYTERAAGKTILLEYSLVDRSKNRITDSTHCLIPHSSHDGFIINLCEPEIIDAAGVILSLAPRLSGDVRYLDQASVSPDERWGAILRCKYKGGGLLDTTERIDGCAVLIFATDRQYTSSVKLDNVRAPSLLLVPDSHMVVVLQGNVVSGYLTTIPNQ